MFDPCFRCTRYTINFYFLTNLSVTILVAFLEFTQIKLVPDLLNALISYRKLLTFFDNQLKIWKKSVTGTLFILIFKLFEKVIDVS